MKYLVDTNILIYLMNSKSLKLQNKFTSMDAFEYGDIRADLELQGNIIGANDLLIAAQARRLNLIVLTANIYDYERVKKLKVENWV
jgi:tRNA(fMet)-specific endonuclease VapC